MAAKQANPTSPARRKRASPTADPQIEAIRAALEGPVIEVFRREIPELRGLPRAAAYDKVMNDPKMLDQCFRLFRSRAELFSEVVIDGERRAITEDNAVLACGRTLAEAVALVVRASARRYFRAKLDFRRFAPPPAKPTLGKRLALALGLAHPPPPKPMFKGPSRSEALYNAIRDQLRFDWQVMLIPHYAPMTPALVSNLGERLLDIREAAELQALAAPGAAPRDGKPPLLLDESKRLLMQGRETIDAEVLWRVVQQMNLARLFPKTDATQIRRLVAQVSATHADVIKVLLPVVGGDVRRFTAFLMIAFSTLGDQRFKQYFCQNGHVHAARKLAERLGRVPPPPPSLDEMTRVYGAILGTAYTGGVEAGATGQDLLASTPALSKALDAMGKSKAPPVSISGSPEGPGAGLFLVAAATQRLGQVIDSPTHRGVGDGVVIANQLQGLATQAWIGLGGRRFRYRRFAHHLHRAQRPDVVAHVVEKVRDLNLEGARQIEQPRATDPIGATLVFLHLLEGQADHLAEAFLA